MKGFETILCATDFSGTSAAAADYARYLATLTGAKLHVLHVIGELADQRRSKIQPEAFELFEKEVEVQAVKDLEAFCDACFAGKVNYSSEAVIGIPFKEILRKAEEIGADLIVLGTHGRTGIEHVIVGSTAERIQRRSKVPVLTVRGSA